jgi:mRNA interferase YafQ
MKTFRYARAYKKDLKRISRRGYDLSLLASVLNALREGQQLPPERRDHPLRGDWQGWRECHIEPDWLLIYRADADEVVARPHGHTC